MREYETLIEVIDKESAKWAARLNHQTKTETKDVFESYLCSTIIYELERIKQQAAQRIAQDLRDQVHLVTKTIMTEDGFEQTHYPWAGPTIYNYNSEKLPVNLSEDQE